MDYNFPVQLQPLFLEGNREIPDRKAVVRTDTMQALGIVSNDYGLVKHGTVIDTFREAAKEYGVNEKIALTNNGGNLFYEMQFPSIEAEVQKGDIVKMRLIVKNSYNGMNSLQIIFGALRLVCLNGMVIGTKFLAFSYRHIGNVNGMVDSLETEDVKESYRNYIGMFSDSMETMNAMTKRNLMFTDGLFTKEQVRLPEYLLQEAKSSFNKQQDITVWGYYNALTAAITHSMRKENPQTSVTFGAEAWKAANKLL